MSAVASPKDLRRQLMQLWSAETDKPKAFIFLAVPGRVPGDELRPIAEELGLQFINIHLNQVVTPEQHLLFTQDKPRMVVMSGIDRLTPGERDAFVRLIHNGPRTLPIVLCPVDLHQAQRIGRAWARLRALEQEQESRMARYAAAKGSSPQAAVPIRA
nr:hypothetical protein [Sphingomonas sp. CDS-1]